MSGGAAADTGVAVYVQGVTATSSPHSLPVPFSLLMQVYARSGARPTANKKKTKGIIHPVRQIMFCYCRYFNQDGNIYFCKLLFQWFDCLPSNDYLDLLHRLRLRQNGLNFLECLSGQRDAIPLEHLVTCTHTQIYPETSRHILLPDCQYTDHPTFGRLTNIFTIDKVSNVYQMSYQVEGDIFDYYYYYYC